MPVRIVGSFTASKRFDVRVLDVEHDSISRARPAAKQSPSTPDVMALVGVLRLFPPLPCVPPLFSPFSAPVRG